MAHDLRKRLQIGGDCICEQARTAGNRNVDPMLKTKIKGESKNVKTEMNDSDEEEEESLFPRECDSDCNDCSDCIRAKSRARLGKRHKVGRPRKSLAVNTNDLFLKASSKMVKGKRVRKHSEVIRAGKIIRASEKLVKRRRTLGDKVIVSPGNVKRRRSLGDNIVESGRNVKRKRTSVDYDTESDDDTKLSANVEIADGKTLLREAYASTSNSEPSRKTLNNKGCLSALQSQMKRLDGRITNQETVVSRASCSVDDVITKMRSNSATELLHTSADDTVMEADSPLDLSPRSSKSEVKSRFESNLEMPVPTCRPGIQRNVLEETRLQYPQTPHQWLDGGRLLLLSDPRSEHNMPLFRLQWRRSAPILVSNCHRYLDADLWTPNAFSEEFGHLRNDLVDCAHKGVVLSKQPMNKFWAGFECIKDRMTDKHGNPMILKLKDWPPKADFSEIMPSRFVNLLQALPLPEYTHRDGVYNLASCLPDYFLRPDLGPKMYNAYGSALHPLVGSTNLHLDISDAINMILYVGVPTDDKKNHEAGALKSMKEAGCCELSIKRVLEDGAKPGALWHIFDPQDADKIRLLLNKVAYERGESVEYNTDPIHDQSSYLDEKLRRRLLREYNVQGYTIVQCLGDSIFIPAGAPHQVRNLHSCIKAAEDFVSPENLSVCFNLTQEFRRLADTHSNHEDKLQVKNIIYHAVKDAVSVLSEDMSAATSREHPSNGIF